MAIRNPAPTKSEDHSRSTIWSWANSGIVLSVADRKALTTPVIPADVRSRIALSDSSAKLLKRLCQKVRRLGTPQARFRAFSTNTKTQVDDQPTMTMHEKTI